MDYVAWILAGVSIIINIIQLINNSKTARQNRTSEIKKENDELFEKNRIYRTKYEELENQYKELKRLHEEFVKSKSIECDEYSQQVEKMTSYNPFEF